MRWVEIVYFYLIEFLLLIIILINIIKVYICILLYKIYIEEWKVLSLKKLILSAFY